MLKNTSKIWLRRAFSSLGSVTASKHTKTTIRVLMYHDVERVPSNTYSVSTNMFEEQMKYLRNNFDILSLNEAFEFLTGQKELKSSAIVVTMDDGYSCIFENALPLLKKYDVPACVFFTTGAWKSDADPREAKIYLNKNEVKEMRAAGILFGGHTRSHCMLSKVSFARAKDEIVGSKTDLENVLNERIYFFAYPYGLRRHFNRQAQEIAREVGYKCAFTAINGTNLPGCDLFALKRTKIERNDSLKNFKRIVNGALDIWGIIDSI
jgi:peptidoglycan/xylan/chitin deacetylase (PgdA/CDA1 family)